MTEPLHVIVVGGGIAGLCLAQGLRQAGVSVAVYERDRSPADRLEGYRIHLNPAGSRALKTCLPPQVWDSSMTAASPPETCWSVPMAPTPRYAGNSSRTPSEFLPKHYLLHSGSH